MALEQCNSISIGVYIIRLTDLFQEVLTEPQSGIGFEGLILLSNPDLSVLEGNQKELGITMDKLGMDKVRAI